MQRAILKQKWDTKSEPPIHAFNHEMLDCAVLDSRLPLEQAIVWCLGGFLEAFLLSLPSRTRVGPIGVSICCMQGGKIPFKGILSFVSVAPLSSGIGMRLTFSTDCLATLLSSPSRVPSM